MRALPSLTLRFIDARSMVVSSLADARRALEGRWCNKEARSYKTAARLLAAAESGACRPAVAWSAFERAAREQGLLRATERPGGLRALDKLAASLFAPRPQA
ncbi:DUF982 domain-containing protein [Mesorhizobium sp.]|uniref:DUF982 domain-containing protein n=1 Tax=Mesorhizobium sp. TaxID=1871066 RepID=UPI003BA9D557